MNQGSKQANELTSGNLNASYPAWGHLSPLLSSSTIEQRQENPEFKT